MSRLKTNSSNCSTADKYMPIVFYLQEEACLSIKRLRGEYFWEGLYSDKRWYSIMKYQWGHAEKNKGPLKSK